MIKKLHYEVLDYKRKKILPKLVFLKRRFYLGGGTALALQIGHRCSVDFDYFTTKEFDNLVLLKELNEVFGANKIEIIQDMKDTFTVIIDKTIKISLFKILFTPLLSRINTEYFSLLPMPEIAVMKIIALARAAYRDYFDLYFILKKINLAKIFSLAEKEHKNFDQGIYLKCLLSFDDVEFSPIKFKKGFSRKKEEIFSFIEKKTKEYLMQILP